MIDTKQSGQRMMFLLVILLAILASAAFAQGTTTTTEPTQQLTLSTSKQHYQNNESVVIFITGIFPEQSGLSIQTEANTYQFLGKIPPRISYQPWQEGFHRATLIHNNTVIASTEFTVGQPVTVPEIAFIDNPLSNETVTTQKITRWVDARAKVALADHAGRAHQDFAVWFERNGRKTSLLFDNESYDAHLEFYSGPIKSMIVVNVSAAHQIRMGIEDLSLNHITPTGLVQKHVRSSFALDPSQVNATINATRIAIGTELYKCAAWNFSTQVCHGSWKKVQGLIPGQEYNITLHQADPGFAETGLASINSNKSRYFPGEHARITVVALNPDGTLAGDANISLDIISPSGQNYLRTTSDGSFQQPFLGQYYTDVDLINETGTYTLNVTVTSDRINDSLSSFFVAQSYIAYDIVRSQPHVIDPWAGTYTTSLHIRSLTAETIFNVTELLPHNFTVDSAVGASVSYDPDHVRITWELVPNNSIVGYGARAPLVSPERYEIGPLTIQQTGLVFEEARPWFLAADPTLIDEAIIVNNTNPIQGEHINVTSNLLCSGGGQAIDFTAFIEDDTTQITTTQAGNDFYCADSSQVSVTLCEANSCVVNADCSVSVTTCGNNDDVDISYVVIANGDNEPLPSDNDLIAGATGTTPTFNDQSTVTINADISPGMNASINNTLPQQLEHINLTANVSDTFGLANCTLYSNATPSGGYLIVNKTLAGTGDQCSQNFTLGLTPGNLINLTVIVLDSSHQQNQTSFLVTIQSDALSTPTIIIPTINQYTTDQPFQFNVTFENIPDEPIDIYYYVNGELNQTSAYNTTFNATDGYYILNVSISNGLLFSFNTTANFTLDTNNPVVTQVFPNDNAYDDSFTPVQHLFNCSVTDNLALFNVSLFITDPQNASFAFNQTAQLTGNDEYADWTIPLTGGNYTWNCLAYDETGNFDWGQNRSLLINGSEPPPPPPRTFNTTPLSCSAISCISVSASSPCSCLEIEENEDDFAGTVGTPQGLDADAGDYAQVNASFAGTIIPTQEINFVNLTILWSLEDAAGTCSVDVYNGSDYVELSGVGCPGTTEEQFSRNITDILATPQQVEQIRVRINYSRGNPTRGLYVDVINLTVNSTFDFPPEVNATTDTPVDQIEFRDTVFLNAIAADVEMLDAGQVIVNDTGFWRYFNFSLTGVTDTFSQNTTVSCAEGCVFNFSARVNDSAGNIDQNDTIIFVLDTIPPSTNVSINNSGPFINDVVNITANASDGILLDFCQVWTNNSVGGGYISVNRSLNGRNDQCSQNFTIVLGRFNVINFTTIINDSSGNVNQTEIIITVQNTPPGTPVILQPPQQNIYTNVVPILINATYWNSDNDLANLSYYVNGVLNQTSPDNTTLNVSDGYYIINVSVFDGLDSSAANDTINITFDATDPFVNFTLLTLPNNTYVNDVSFLVNVTVNETNFANITYFLYDNNFNLLNRTNYTSRILFINYTTLPSFNARYLYNVTVFDRATQSSSTETREITFDNQIPSVRLIEPFNNSEETTNTFITFSFNASDASPIGNCSLIIDDVLVKTSSSVSVNESSTIGYSLLNGNYNWSINCTDQAGNVNQSFARNLTVNVPIPPRTYYESKAGIGDVTEGERINLTVAVDADTHQVTLTPPSGPDKEWFVNASLLNRSEYGRLGIFLPASSLISFTGWFDTGSGGGSGVPRWNLSIVNSSGEYEICTDTDTVAFPRDAPTEYTGSCLSPTQNIVLTPDQNLTLQVLTVIQSPSKIHRHYYGTTRESSVSFNAFQLGEVQVNISNPLGIFTINETKAFNISCNVSCVDETCLGTNVFVEYNTSTEKWNLINNSEGNFLLQGSQQNPVTVGLVNGTEQEINFSIVPVQPSTNNSIRCSATSDFSNLNGTRTTIVAIDDIIYPNVTLLNPENNSAGRPDFPISFEYRPLDNNLKNCSLWGNFTGVWHQNLTNSSPTSAQTNEFVTNLSLGLYQWNVQCYDFANQSNFSAHNFSLIVAGDLAINASHIVFSNDEPVELETIAINITILNLAGKNESNVSVQAFEQGEFGKESLGANQTINVSAFSNNSVIFNWTARLGNTSLVFVVDPEFGTGKITESDEVNNLANISIFVAPYHIYYGNVSTAVLIDLASNDSVYEWAQGAADQSVILAADADSVISFATLQALGRNVTGNVSINSSNDFSDLDAALNLTNTTQNVNTTWTFDGLPRVNASFTVQQVSINHTATVNSTNTSSFVTGILWDYNDVHDGHYNGSQDVLFISFINVSQLGTFGVADFEIKVPAALRAYVQPNSEDAIDLYLEIP